MDTLHPQHEQTSQKMEGLESKIFDLIEKITPEDIENFRKLILPIFLPGFDGCEEDKKMELVALHKLTPEERAFIRDSKEFGGHLVGLHDIQKLEFQYRDILGIE